MALPGQARLPGVHDNQADRHGDGDVNETDQQQLAPLAQREAGADERIEDRKEDERDGERLEQRDDEQAELAQLLVTQAAQIGLLTEEGAQQRAADDGDEHLGVEGQWITSMTSGSSSIMVRRKITGFVRRKHALNGSPDSSLLTVSSGLHQLLLIVKSWLRPPFEGKFVCYHIPEV